MRKQFVKNSLSGVFVLAISTLLLLVTIPIFLRLLGKEAYGVFSLIMVIGNLNTFANLGLSAALIKFISEQGKVTESHHDIIVNSLLLLSILLPIVATGIFFRDFVVTNILNVPGKFLDEARPLFICVLIANSFLLLGQTFTAILDSQQKIYVTNFIQLLYNTSYWGLILLVVSLGGSLEAIGDMILLTSVAWFCIVGYAAFRVWGHLHVEGLRGNFIYITKKQLSYSVQIYASGIMGFFYEPLTKLLVSHYIGLAEVGYYDIALRVRNQIWGVIGKLLYPLFPLIAQLKDEVKVRLLVHDLEQKTFFLVVPLVVLMMFLSRPFVALWLGEDIDAISMTIAYIVSAYLVGSATVLPNYQYLMAKGHASKTVILQSVNVVVNAVVFFFTYSWMGYYAVIAGGATAILSSFGLSVYYQKKYLSSLIFDSPRQLGLLLTVLLVDVALAGALDSLLLNNLSKLISITIAIGLASAAMFRFLRLINSEDIVRYFGEKGRLSTVGLKIFVR